MVRDASARDWQELDEFVEAYELAWHGRSAPALADFLPPRGHARYPNIVLELVRVDIELRWQRGCARSLDDYRRQFPDLLDDPRALAQVAFEEFRARRQRGETVTAADYARQYGIDTARWPAISAAVGSVSPDSASAATNRPVGSGHVPPRDVACRFPAVGTDLSGFHLEAELGRGAFSRVYLARQGELAGRRVVLKVSTESFAEADRLAQLQHGNIVPIYSVHQTGTLSAVCMPYFGPTTLADVLDDLRTAGGVPPSGRRLVETLALRRDSTLRNGSRREARPESHRPDGDRDASPGAAAMSWESFAPTLRMLEGRSYVEAVLWMTARLADGLAHAHEQGIVHRDLKPANILLADDGRPMLLDFNLSDDVKVASGAASAVVGGTLPYMAPEQLLAFAERRPHRDPRSDLYALGVILYELLTGRFPFPSRSGALDGMLAELRDDRLRPPADLRRLNPAVTPAAEAIVVRCLHADPAGRYRSAAELRDDLDRHLAHLPLRFAREPSLRERTRKWVRRHPRATSATTMAVVAAMLLCGLAAAWVVRSDRLARLEAAESFRAFQADLRDARLRWLDAASAGRSEWETVAATCRAALERFDILEDPTWPQAESVRRLPAEQQQRLRSDAGEMLFLAAAVARLQASGESADARRRTLLEQALEWNRRAEPCDPDGHMPAALWHQRGVIHDQLGQRAEAERCFALADAAPPRSPRDFCLRACLYSAERRYRDALPLWQAASAQEPQNLWAWAGLGDCYGRLAQPASAAACYTACIALAPEGGDWHVRRGIAWLQQKEFALAKADFDAALRRQPVQIAARINRALAHLGQSQRRAAIVDLNAVLNDAEGDVRVLLLRAQARDGQGDAAGARQDRRQSLACEPTDEAGWIARGVARVEDDPAGALADFDRALDWTPQSRAALECKAHVLSERLGRTDAAVQVLDRAIGFHPDDAALVAARGVLLARLGRREMAERDARQALSLDASATIAYQVAGIYALNSRRVPGDRAAAFSLLTAALRQGYGVELLSHDADLDPLREDRRFALLLDAVRTLHADGLNADPPGGVPKN